MRSPDSLCGGLSAAVLSEALNSDGTLSSGSTTKQTGRRARWTTVILGAAFSSLPIVPLAAQQIAGPPGGYAPPYGNYSGQPQNPYAQPYGGAPQPNGYGSPYGYGQAQQQAPPYPQQQPYYPQQPYAQSPSPQPGYGQQQYAQPGGYAGQDDADAAPEYGPQDPSQPPAGYGTGLGAEQEQGQGEMQALDPTQLQQLVAPVALYPDALLAEVVTAATYPAQVVAADAWLDAQGNAPPGQVAAGANAHSDWDPSVKSLTAFPQVLDMMARNLQWSTDLGNAYYNQPQDLMQTVQVLRQRAEDAGTLRGTPQEPLNYQNGYIQLEPANDQTAYVPQYDPWTVYGNQISPFPGFSLAGAIGSFFTSGLGQNAIRYGLGTALGSFGGMPWGFLSWGLNWLANAVLFNHSDYFTRSTSVSDWGLRYGGPRAYGRRDDRERYGHGDYARGGRNWDRGYVAGRTGYGRTDYGSDRGYRGERGEAFAGGSREFYGSRGNEQFNPRYGRPAYGGPASEYGRSGIPAHESFGRSEPRIGEMPSSRDRGARFGNSFNAYGRTGDGRGYSARPGMAFANPSRGMGAPEGYGRGNSIDRHGSESYGGSFGRQQKSGGFHLFGGSHGSDSYGGHASNGFFGGKHAPKEFRGGGFGGGRTQKMPKMPKQRSFGGGHFGGGHSGGGHFGHSSGGHSGGHGSSHHHH